jgi:hypothetical protein
VLFTGLVLILAGAGMGTVSALTIAYPLRLAGDPGLLTVHSCLTTGTGKQALTTCYGDFTADSGDVVARRVGYGGALRVGATLPVQYVASQDDCYRVGVAYTAVRVTGLSFGLLTAATGLIALTAAVGVAVPRRAERRREQPWPPGLRRWIARVLVASAAVTVVSGATSLIAYLVEP